jgi:hypothetical protein
MSGVGITGVVITMAPMAVVISSAAGASVGLERIDTRLERGGGPQISFLLATGGTLIDIGGGAKVYFLRDAGGSLIDIGGGAKVCILLLKFLVAQPLPDIFALLGVALTDLCFQDSAA